MSRDACPHSSNSDISIDELVVIQHRIFPLLELYTESMEYETVIVLDVAGW
jgi:hypothetical protein